MYSTMITSTTSRQTATLRLAAMGCRTKPTRPWEVMDLGAANFDYDWLNDTLYNTNSTRASRGRKFQNEAPIAYKTKIRMRPEDVGKRLHTQKFLHSAVFTHRFLLQEETFTQKSVFTDTLSCSTLISCERVAPGASTFDPHFVRQFLTFNRHFARKMRASRLEIAILHQFLTFGLHSVRQGCAAAKQSDAQNLHRGPRLDGHRRAATATLREKYRRVDLAGAL